MEVLARRECNHPLNVNKTKSFLTSGRSEGIILFPSTSYLSVLAVLVFWLQNITDTLARSLNSKVIVILLIVYWQAASPCGSAA